MKYFTLSFFKRAFLGVCFFSQLFAQTPLVVIHRSIGFSSPQVPGDFMSCIRPNFSILMGPPTFTSSHQNVKAEFSVKYGTEFRDSIQAISALYSEPIILQDDSVTVQFQFGFTYFRIDSLLDPGTNLNINYLICDYDTKEVIDTALTVLGAPNTRVFFDSANGQYYTVHYVKGTRSHRFKAKKGERIFTRPTFDYSAFRDDITYVWGIVETMTEQTDSSEFLRNQLPRYVYNEPQTITKKGKAVTDFNLLPAYPNPFNPLTQIPVILKRTAQIRLEIFDLRGRLVRTLFSSRMPAGTHLIKWDGKNDLFQEVPAGIYFCRLLAPGFSKTQKLLLLK